MCTGAGAVIRSGRRPFSHRARAPPDWSQMTCRRRINMLGVSGVVHGACRILAFTWDLRASVFHNSVGLAPRPTGSADMRMFVRRVCLLLRARAASIAWPLCSSRLVFAVRKSLHSAIELRRFCSCACCVGRAFQPSEDDCVALPCSQALASAPRT